MERRSFIFQIKQYIDGGEGSEHMIFLHPLTTFTSHLSRDEELLLDLDSATTTNVEIVRENEVETPVMDVRGQGPR